MDIFINTPPQTDWVNIIASTLSVIIVGCMTVGAMFKTSDKQLQNERYKQNIDNARRYEQHYLQFISTLRNILSLYNKHYHDIVMIRMAIIGNNPIDEQLNLKFQSINLEIDMFKDLLVLEETAKLALNKSIEIMVSEINKKVKDLMFKINSLYGQLIYACFSENSKSMKLEEQLEIIKNDEGKKITEGITKLVEYFGSDSFYTEISELYKKHTLILKTI